MLPSVLILGAVFFGVVALVFGVAMLLKDQSLNQMEDRLNAITGKGKNDPASLAEVTQLFASQVEGKNAFERAMAQWFNLTLLFEQAEVSMSIASFLGTCLGLGMLATIVCTYLGLSLVIAPMVGFVLRCTALLLVVVPTTQSLQEIRRTVARSFRTRGPCLACRP